MDDIDDDMSDVFSSDPVRSRQAIHSIADALKHIQSAEGADPYFEEKNFIHNLDAVLNNGDLTAEAKILKIVEAYSKFSANHGNDANLILTIEEKFLQRGWSNVNVDTLERLYSEIMKLTIDLKEQWYTCRHCVINYPEDKFQCTSCDSNFFHFVSLQFHISKSHVSLAANSNLSCPECGMFFNRDISAMKNHYEDEHLCRRGHETCPVGCRVLLPVSKNPEDSVFQHVARNHVCTVCNEKTLDNSQHLLLFHDIDSPENDDPEQVGKSLRDEHVTRSRSPYDIANLRSNKNAKRPTSPLDETSTLSASKDHTEDEKTIECQICGFDIPINGFPCKVCPEKFDYHVDTLMHMRKEHRMKIDFAVECGVCKIEGGLSEMHYHLTTKHACVSSHLRCPRECSKLFESEDDIMRHLKKSHGVGPVPSKSKESKTSESSKKHTKLKNGDLERKSFDWREKLHNRSASNRSSRERSNEKPKRKDVVLSSTTPKSFAEWEEFIEATGPMNLGLPGFSVHLAPIQRISLKAISYHSSKLKCQKCKLKYPKNLLSCSECADVFCTPGSLAFHQYTVHKVALDKYYCDCCAETFSTCNDLIVHELSKVCNNHYECPFGCDCLFTHQVKLLDHIKTHHSSSIPPSTANMMPFGLSTYKKNSQNTAKFSCEKCKLICLPEENWAYCKLCEDRGHKMKMRIKYVVGLEFLTHLVRFHKLNVAMKLYCMTCKEPFTDVLDFHSHQKQKHGFCGIHVACPAEGCGVITHVPRRDRHFEKCQLFQEQFPNGLEVSNSPDVIVNEPFSLSNPVAEKQILSGVSYPSGQPMFHASNGSVQLVPKLNPNLMPPPHMPNFVNPGARMMRPPQFASPFLQTMPALAPRPRVPYRLPMPLNMQPPVSRKRAPMVIMPQAEIAQIRSMPAVVHDLIDETVEYAAERKARKMMSDYAATVLEESIEDDVVPLQKGSILGAAPVMTPDEMFRPREQRVIMAATPKLAERHMATLSKPQNFNQQTKLISASQYSNEYLNDGQIQIGEYESNKRKIGKCNKCRYKYEVDAMTFDHFCEECELYFIKDYELLIHLTVFHAIETDEDTTFSCDICPESDKKYDLSDLLAHRTEKHEACLGHMRCANDPCNFMFSTAEEMNKHTKNTCIHRVKDRNRSRDLESSTSASKTTLAPSGSARSAASDRNEARSSGVRSLKRIKPSEEAEPRPLDPISESGTPGEGSESNIISFDESKRYFRTKNPASAEGRTQGCLDCGQVKPADKYFDCRLCDQVPGIRVSEKQFALFLEALIHLVTKHDFIITDVNQSCKSPECINEFGAQLVFDSVEEYHFHGVKNHGLCRRHFLCPYACGTVFTDSKDVSPHMRYCFLGSRKSSFQPSLVLPTV